MTPALPTIIQGGMGVGISGWRLARAVSQAGQLGIVSGVALDVLLAHRLQNGDPEGDLRRAMEHFPFPAVVERVMETYFVPGGIDPDRPFRPLKRLDLHPSASAMELAVLASFAEIYLAKEGHDGIVGLNLLEKIQVATPTAAYGAMLAGADFLIMGAGIPSEIPAMLNQLARGESTSISIPVDGAPSSARYTIDLDPSALFGPGLPQVGRPTFLAIVSNHILANYLARDPVTRPDGFVLETPVAGGHSAPPRGAMTLDDQGDPVYGKRDEFDLTKTSAVGLPFWLAGGYASPERLADAIASGATGIQVGSAFALCRESGFAPHIRQAILKSALDGSLTVRNHPRASPTGFPFKLAPLDGTGADQHTYTARRRICDIGYLRTVYAKDDGSIGYRCPAEPVDHYVRKGGSVEDTSERRCLCNGLVASTGVGQRRPGGYVEPPLVTFGQDLSFLPALLSAFGDDYGAADVIEYLLHPSSTERTI